MDDDRAFLNEILACPEDDIPRLIYADWLEEQGNPRGEFIRVQCELAMMDHDHPRYFDLAERNDELLEAHKDEWVSEFQQETRKVEFHRGFIDTITVKARSFGDVAESLYESTPVHWLRLNYLKGVGEKLAQSGEMQRITGLDLGRLTIPDADLHALFTSPHLKQLQYLNLGSIKTFLGEEIGRAIATSAFRDQLQTLNVLDAAEVEPGFQRQLAAGDGYPHLKSISVGLGYLSSHFRSLQGLHVPELESLQVRGYLSSTDTNVLSALTSNLPQLKHLDIAHTNIESSGITKLDQTRVFQQLHSLNLSFCELTDEELLPLFEGNNLRECRQLDISVNDLTDRVLQRLAQCESLSQLQRLHLGTLRFQEQAILEFFHSPNFGGLLELSLRHSELTPQAASSMQRSSFRESVRTLNLDGCFQDMKTVEAFTEVEFPSLTRISLDQCEGLNQDGFLCLLKTKSMPNLRSINMKHNGCSPLTLFAIANSDAFPELRELHFYGGTSTNDAVRAVLESPTLPKLKKLSVMGTTGMRNRPKLKKEFGDRFSC